MKPDFFKTNKLEKPEITIREKRGDTVFKWLNANPTGWGPHFCWFHNTVFSQNVKKQNMTWLIARGQPKTILYSPSLTLSLFPCVWLEVGDSVCDPVQERVLGRGQGQKPAGSAHTRQGRAGPWPGTRWPLVQAAPTRGNHLCCFSYGSFNRLPGAHWKHHRAGLPVQVSITLNSAIPTPHPHHSRARTSGQGRRRQEHL